MGSPLGEISVKDMSSRYKAFDYLFHDRLIITEIKWEGVKVDLPQGIFSNWVQLQHQIEDQMYLIPPVPKRSPSTIEIQNFSAQDIDINMGKNMDPSVPPLFPFMMMSSRLLGQGTAPGFVPGGLTPAMPSAPKPQNNFESFRLNHFEIANARFGSPLSKQPSTLSKMKIENLVIEKAKVDLGRLEVDSDKLSLTVLKSPQSGTAWENLIVDLNGMVKQGANEHLKKDIRFLGRFAESQFTLSAFEGKVALKIGKPAGGFMPAVELNASGLSLPDYFVNVAPITDINFSFKPENFIVISDQTLVKFNLGAGQFEGTAKIPTPFKKGNDYVELLTGQHTKVRNLSAAVVIDSAVPGRLRVKLWNPPSSPPEKYLLSKVWYGKNFTSLTSDEMEFLKTISVYFGIDPKEFERVPKKQPKIRKATRRRAG